MNARPAARQRGFTLIELLIVVAIIGILAAIAIPNLLTAMQRARAKRTMADMRTIGQAWEAYAIEHNGYSAAGRDTQEPVEPVDSGIVAVTYGELTGMLTPDYIKTIPELDGWGNPFVFARSSDGSAYLIGSTGADGVGGSTQAAIADRTVTVTEDFDADIYFVNGNFVSYPGSVSDVQPAEQTTVR